MPTIELQPTGRDDADCISKILSAVGTCTIQLGAGTFDFKTPIVQTSHGTKIVGYGEATQIHKLHHEPAFFLRANDLVHERFVLLNAVDSFGVGIYSDAQIRGCVTNNVRFREFGVAIEVLEGIVRWSCHRCVFNNSRVAGIRLRHMASPDTGNAQISECVFSEGSPTPLKDSCGIWYGSGGGLWVDRCSFLGMERGFVTGQIQPVTQGTADLFIAGCSFELQRSGGIKIDSMDVPGFTIFHVSDSHFMCTPTAKGWTGIDLNWDQMSVVVLTDNDFQLGADGAKAISARHGKAIKCRGNLATVAGANVQDVWDAKGNEGNVDWIGSELVKV